MLCGAGMVAPRGPRSCGSHGDRVGSDILPPRRKSDKLSFSGLEPSSREKSAPPPGHEPPSWEGPDPQDIYHHLGRGRRAGVSTAPPQRAAPASTQRDRFAHPCDGNTVRPCSGTHVQRDSLTNEYIHNHAISDPTPRLLARLPRLCSVLWAESSCPSFTFSFSLWLRCRNATSSFVNFR